MLEMLQDKVVLITGSSRGIGAATARLADEYGADVVPHGRTASEGLIALATELDAPFITCDVTDGDAVKAEVARVIDRFNRIDVLINSAAIVSPKPFLESTDEDWLSVYRTNVLGIVHFCQAVIPHMQRAGGGRIVNIASVRGHNDRASEHIMAYSASKAAVINFTVALAREVRGQNIAVTSVSPGFTETDMAATWSEENWAEARSSHLGRPATPEEIARVILSVAVSNALIINGQDIRADGGR